MPDGSPHVAPVWFDYDGTHILIDSAVGRVKDKNMRRDPRVGIDILDPDNPYRHLSIRGRVVRSPKKAPTSISTSSPRSTPAKTNIRIAGPTKCACSIKSNPRRPIR